MAHDEEHGMTIPNQLSMEALLAEDGQCVSAGLPLPLRPADEQLSCGKDTLVRSESRRERLERLMAEIAVEESRLKELHRELERVVRETLEHWV